MSTLNSHYDACSCEHCSEEREEIALERAKREWTPALEGMEALGREKLTLLANRWQELIEQERVEELRMEARAEVMRGVRMEVAFVSFDVLCARTAIRSQRVRVAATEAQR